jgi:undecaprenyl diphosphate synthase
MEKETTQTDKNYPKHIALIVDGNRRWAKRRGLPTLEGHRKGMEMLEKVLDTAKEHGVECVTLWVFSTENWKRSKDEVEYLFGLFRTFFEKYKKKCIENKVRFVHLGRKDRIDPDIRKSIESLENETKDFKNNTIALALDYGGHDELIRTINKLMTFNLEITQENIENNLDTASLPPVDLIIRTSGEKRLSGFLSWQCAYSELYFTDKTFPEFTPEELKIALDDFAQRERRFGGESKGKL